MDSLHDILAQRGAPDDPEILAVKHYIEAQFHTPISVAMHGSVLVVTVPSAALASTLRLGVTKIQAACRLEKRLIFRIG